MSLISILVALILVGFVLYLIQTLLPLDPRIKQIISAVVIIFLVLYILQGFGFLGGSHVRID